MGSYLGLVNVSGFHVDPGFKGRLKFSVYNAGSRDITITRGDRVFLIWYADLDGMTEDGYGDAGPDQDMITSNDQNVMHGEIASPAELKTQLEAVKHSDVNKKWLLGVVAAALVGILVRLMFMQFFADPSSSQIERMKTDIMTEIRQEVSERKKKDEGIIGSSEAKKGGENNRDKPSKTVTP